MMLTRYASSASVWQHMYHSSFQLWTIMLILWSKIGQLMTGITYITLDLRLLINSAEDKMLMFWSRMVTLLMRANALKWKIAHDEETHWNFLESDYRFFPSSVIFITRFALGCSGSVSVLFPIKILPFAVILITTVTYYSHSTRHL